MHCPKCRAPMEIVSFGEVEVERCTRCAGLWFDMLEHEDLAALPGSEAVDSGSRDTGMAADSNDRIRCPKCDNPLINMVVVDQPHIRYESCIVCYGLYFDAGEFTDYRTLTVGEGLRALLARLRLRSAGGSAR